MDKLFEHFHSYIDLLNEGHCIMVDIAQRGKIVEFVSQIPNECVYEEKGEHYGKELNPHVTVMYGLSESEEKRVKELLSKVPKRIVAELGQISKFENADAPYDVLKIEVKSQHLAKIHEMVKKNFENNYQWPEYNPHVTLAYVKKGTCNEYVGSKIFEGMKFTFENFTYSNGNREQNHKVNMKEYFVGQSGGYGGGAMTGGQVAPTNWAGTFSSNQTSRRLNDYPASRRYTYMQGNTVIGSSLYDTLTQDDLIHPKFSPQEIFAGLRKEMSRMEYPDKDVAKKTVLANLEKDPKFYSDLHMYFNSDKEGSTIMENIDPKELEMGIKVEKEHTEDKALAKKIAMDHLKEDPKYYTKLKKAGLKEDEGRDEFDFDDDEIDFGDESGDELEVGDDLGSGDEMEDSEESAADSELGSVTPIAPSIAVIKISEPIDANQTALASSGLGSGSPKPLRTDKLTAPTEKNKVGPNKVVVSRTPPVGGQVGCDPIDHFGSQMLEKW